MTATGEPCPPCKDGEHATVEDGTCTCCGATVPGEGSRVTVVVTVEFPMGKFDVHKTGSRFDVTNVIHEALVGPDGAFDFAEVRYA